MPDGVVLEPTVQTIDLMPTLLELAGLAAPGRAQGASLVELMGQAARGEEQEWRRPAVTEKAALEEGNPTRTRHRGLPAAVVHMDDAEALNLAPLLAALAPAKDFARRLLDVHAVRRERRDRLEHLDLLPRARRLGPRERQHQHAVFDPRRGDVQPLAVVEPESRP